MIIKKAQFYKRGTIRVLGWSPDVMMTAKGSNSSGEIRLFSRKSRQRLMFIMTETEIEFESMVTLTYPREFGLNGLKVKKDLRKMLSVLQKCFGAYLAYAWIIEFQARGAPHFHLLLNVTPDNRERYFVALAWAEICTKNDEERDKVFFVHSRPEAFSEIYARDGARHYIAKYALKPEQKIVPERYQNVGRFWGVSGNVLGSIPEPTTIDITEDNLRLCLQNINTDVAMWPNLPSYIFAKYDKKD